MVGGCVSFIQATRAAKEAEKVVVSVPPLARVLSTCCRFLSANCNVKTPTVGVEPVAGEPV